MEYFSIYLAFWMLRSVAGILTQILHTFCFNYADEFNLVGANMNGTIFFILNLLGQDQCLVQELNFVY